MTLAVNRNKHKAFAAFIGTLVLDEFVLQVYNFFW